MATTLTENTLVDTAANPANAGPAIECLCPFCGSFNRGVGQPCQHCRTEDTTAARAAARKRVGPWFVLQSKNLAAPGIGFVALLAMIRQGIVTDRSVIRGPATGQLWRLAGKVRGISREFGQCYGCDGELSVLDPLCPHCQRPQSLPADVDATEEPTPAPRPTPAAAPTPGAYVPSADRGHRPPPKQDLLTPRDLAKAFSLGFGAPAGHPTDAPQTLSDVSLNDLLPRSASFARPKPGTLAKVVAGVVVVIAGGWSISRALMPRPTGPVDIVSFTGDRVGVTPTAPASAAPTYPQPTYARATPASPVVPVAMVRPAVAEPAAVPAAASFEPMSAAAEDDPKRLMSLALDAEARGDYAAAVTHYERIESLSSDQWPADLRARLKVARRAARGD
jgi:hypothetical protein